MDDATWQATLARLDARMTSGVDPCATRAPNGAYYVATSQDDMFLIRTGNLGCATIARHDHEQPVRYHGDLAVAPRP